MANPVRKDGLMKLQIWGPLAPLGLSLAALIFLVDQVHKWWMLSIYGIEEKSPVQVTSFFDLVMVWNQGVSYGFLSGSGPTFLIAISLLIIVVLWLWLCRLPRPLTAAAIGLVIGGALANVLDRVRFGAVADLFHLHWGDFSWYVFNLADMAIVAGVGLLLYESLMERRLD
jgi:signal peptidase II